MALVSPRRHRPARPRGIPFPRWLWDAARLVGLSAIVGQLALLLCAPQLGLAIFWGCSVPLLPICFLLAPSIWRNVCPMATFNQLPRRVGISRYGSIPRRLSRQSVGLSGLFFITLASCRRMLFNTDANALFLLILALMTAALLSGYFFRGKSGWCGSFCPLASIERAYARQPVIAVRDTHCGRCTGCMSQCIDVSKPVPRVSRGLWKYRGNDAALVMVSGGLPGFIAWYYMLFISSRMSLPVFVTLLFILMAISLGMLVAVAALAGVESATLTVSWIAMTFTLYAWFSSTVLVSSMRAIWGQPAAGPAIWVLRAALVSIGLAWYLRALGAGRWKRDRVNRHRAAAEQGGNYGHAARVGSCLEGAPAAQQQQGKLEMQRSCPAARTWNGEPTTTLRPLLLFEAAPNPRPLDRWCGASVPDDRPGPARWTG